MGGGGGVLRVSVAVMNVVKEMPDHGWFFNVMEGNRVGRTTILSQQESPFFVVLFIPIIFSGPGMLPHVMVVWSERMKALSFLLISCIRKGDTASFLQTFGNHYIFHGSSSFGGASRRLKVFHQALKGRSG